MQLDLLQFCVCSEFEFEFNMGSCEKERFKEQMHMYIIQSS